MKWIKNLFGFCLRRVMRSSGVDKQNILIREFEFKDNTTTMVLQHPEFARLAEGIVGFFKAKGGINYVATDMYHPELGFFEIIVQRKNGKTPAQLNMELKAKIVELEEKLSRSCV
jgi:hypothetical protein